MSSPHPIANTPDHSGLPDSILQILTGMLPPSRPMALHEPVFGEHEAEAVAAAVRSGWVSSVGPEVTAFEAALRGITGAAHAIAVSSGTSALHLSMMGADVGPDTEVLMPAVTFIASANAVSYTGAIPHFVDAEPEQFGIDPVRLRHHLQDIAVKRDGLLVNRITGRRIAAILCVHVFGHPARIVELRAVADEYALPLIEDAAACLGSRQDNRHLGTFGSIGAISFNGNKIVTTGGGGAVVTDNDRIAARIRHLATTARLASPVGDFVHDVVGYNYRLPNLNAALGLAQLTQLDAFVETKRKLAQRYKDAFAGLKGLRVVTEAAGAHSNYWLNALVLEGPLAGLRDNILRVTQQAGILTRPLWHPLHRLPIYQGAPRMDLSVTEDLHARTINLPSSVSVLGAPG
jgi:perosamine synthetase